LSCRVSYCGTCPIFHANASLSPSTASACITAQAAALDAVHLDCKSEHSRIALHIISRLHGRYQGGEAVEDKHTIWTVAPWFEMRVFVTRIHSLPTTVDTAASASAILLQHHRVYATAATWFATAVTSSTVSTPAAVPHKSFETISSQDTWRCGFPPLRLHGDVHVTNREIGWGWFPLRVNGSFKANRQLRTCWSTHIC
jgi:hypothetical protein